MVMHILRKVVVKLAYKVTILIRSFIRIMRTIANGRSN